MPRKLRVEYPGAVYHVMSRGDQRDDIFLCDVDRHDFIKTLAEGCEKAGWQVHALGLMRNHYHLVLEQFRRAGCVGSEEFRRKCLEQMEAKVGENHPGQTRLETAKAKAERIVAEEMSNEGHFLTPYLLWMVVAPSTALPP
jgi:hypothetical protein